MIIRAKVGVATKFRQFSTAIRQRIEDEGDWFYSSEWWNGDPRCSTSQVVFREVSDKGNGVISVLAHPSSKPEKSEWAKTENWLNQRYRDVHPANTSDGDFRVLGYQWRTLHFNDVTRQSTVKVMAACREDDPQSMLIMQQPCCLAVPYVKSMICAGLTAVASSTYDLKGAILGKKTMNILCIGHGGGSLPLFLASKIQGALVDIVEIDPLVISASTVAMGFPRFTLTTASGNRASPSPDTVDDMLWRGTHGRLLLYEADAEKFIAESTKIYDIVYIDAYDGEDIFPHKLWDPLSSFMVALRDRLHPKHGTVVVNLHSDVDLRSSSSVSSKVHLSPMGRYISGVSKAYKDMLLGNRKRNDGGLAFTVAVPWVCNTSLVVSRGLREVYDRNLTLDMLVSKSAELENLLVKICTFILYNYCRYTLLIHLVRTHTKYT